MGCRIMQLMDSRRTGHGFGCRENQCADNRLIAAACRRLLS
jgi:hypothetical protein